MIKIHGIVWHSVSVKFFIGQVSKANKNRISFKEANGGTDTVSLSDFKRHGEVLPTTTKFKQPTDIMHDEALGQCPCPLNCQNKPKDWKATRSAGED